MRAFSERLGRGHFEEHSAKWRPGQWSAVRHLMGVPLNGLSARELQPALPELLSELGMRDDDQAGFLAPLQQAPLPHFLHLGVEEQRCKVYWEAPLPTSPPAGRFALYRAWKWQPGEEASVSEYLLASSAKQVRGWIDAQCQALPDDVEDLLEHLEIQFALRQLPWPPVCVRIEERQHGSATPRHSINLHLHGARLALGRIAGPLFALARSWQVAPRAEVQRWLAQHGNQMLSNLSLGVDHLDRPFFTCYYGGRAAQHANQEH
ncbi:hypothetical protein BWR19_08120 [Halomonas sp. 1513]|nr:hypothetical protein BWR19_08120 [Halomonas sp. 1513]